MSEGLTPRCFDGGISALEKRVEFLEDRYAELLKHVLEYDHRRCAKECNNLISRSAVIETVSMWLNSEKRNA